jgi:hypothetical protein
VGRFITSNPDISASQIRSVLLADLGGDCDLDVIVNHTRWEETDLSWAGIGLWVNQGDGTFDLVRDRRTETWPFPGFAAGAEIRWNDGPGEFRRSDTRFEYKEDTGVAADFDGDGDQDIFVGRNEDDYQVWLNDGKGSFPVVVS